MVVVFTLFYCFSCLLVSLMAGIIGPLITNYLNDLVV